jgi:GAF domain-containing protein
MKRRSGAGGAAPKPPGHTPARLKRRNVPHDVARRSSSAAGAEGEVTRLARELNEALEREVAASEVLRAISSSQGDLQPVFASVLANAVRLCDANFSVLLLNEGEAFRLGAAHNAPPAYVEFRSREPTIRVSGLTARVVSTKQVLHIPDCTEDPSYKQGDADFARFVELCRVRTLLGAPLLQDNKLSGIIGVYRQEVRPFTDKQIELVKNFAAQAVIAIENARLLNDLRQRTSDLSQRTADLTEALERQTATSEVLQVISSSPGDLEPVFAAMLEKAVRICGAKFGNIQRWDGEALHLLAMFNAPPAFSEARRRLPGYHPNPKAPVGRMVATKTVIHVADLAADESYIQERLPPIVTAVEHGGARTILAVPMLKEGELVGALVLFRQEVRPFSDKQIELVKNFAAQAVIAIENARLLNELRQSLEQQTATSEVLQVISSCLGELEPVFQAMLAKATSICEANFGQLWITDGDGFRSVESHLLPRAFAERRRDYKISMAPDAPFSRLKETKRLVHIGDITEEPAYIRGYQPLIELAEIGGACTLLLVPMLKEEGLVGAIAIYRQEVRPFTDKQIDLVANFAAQAVIAIENARLLNELRQRTDDLSQRTTDLGEALEQQTATSEVLQAISASPSDLAPVFATMLEKAVRICEAQQGSLLLYDGKSFRNVATHGAPHDFVEARRRNPVIGEHPRALIRRVAQSKEILHIPDIKVFPLRDDDPTLLELAELAGARTLIIVPMLKELTLIGAIAIYRQEVRPFTDKQIALLTNFAAQAVIAIENARLLKELRDRTEQVEAQSYELAKLNQQLEQRVSDQVGEIERMGRLRRFLPPQVADLIVASGTEKQLESHRREITALFCDLRGFTGFTQSADAEDVMALLRDYHATIGNLIIKYSGTLERYAGDGVMVVFNDPVPVDNPALRAVQMALETREAMAALTEKWRELGHDVGFGIGIAHGFATLGTIGFEGRFDYAAIGTVSNVASRLCDEAKPGQILISPRVFTAVKDAVTVEPVGEFTLKGIGRPLAAYNVLAAVSA